MAETQGPGSPQGRVKARPAQARAPAFSVLIYYDVLFYEDGLNRQAPLDADFISDIYADAGTI
jgi:hypothetical protein